MYSNSKLWHFHIENKTRELSRRWHDAKFAMFITWYTEWWTDNIPQRHLSLIKRAQEWNIRHIVGGNDFRHDPDITACFNTKFQPYCYHRKLPEGTEPFPKPFWLFIEGVLWHSPETYFTRRAHEFYLNHGFIDRLLKLLPNLPGSNEIIGSFDCILSLTGPDGTITFERIILTYYRTVGYFLGPVHQRYSSILGTIHFLFFLGLVNQSGYACAHDTITALAWPENLWPDWMIRIKIRAMQLSGKKYKELLRCLQNE